MTRRGRPERWLRLPISTVVLVLLIVSGVLAAIYMFRTRGDSASAEPLMAPPPAVPPPLKDADGQLAKPASVPAEAQVSKPATASELRRGRLTVSSDPSRARVWVDERPVGMTPLSLSDLPAGEHRLRVERGDRSIRQTVRIDPDNALAVIVPLTPESSTGSGWLAVSAPLDMDILEDDAVVGTTRSPRIMLPAGTHDLRIVHALTGYDRPQRVRIAPGEVARVDVTLPQNTISLNALPWAEVWLDGKFVGETPLGNLPVGLGNHQLVFRHPDLGEKSVSALVKVGEPTRVTADMRK